MENTFIQDVLAATTRRTPTRLLLVDDDESIRFTLELVLRGNGFEVSTAKNVNEALALIGSQTFDVLLSDLHMPHAGDGLTVVGAMRNANPKAVTLIFSAYPEMNGAVDAILKQADEILAKPLSADALIDTIRMHLARSPNHPPQKQSVGRIIECATEETIQDWLGRVNRAKAIVTVALSPEERCEHLPQLFQDLVYRLHFPLSLGSRALPSPAAAEHGLRRRKQGYTAAMLVEESRMLQVSIFQTLQDNLAKVDFSQVLVGVMAIADEVDSQLAQAMTAYISESKIDDLPVVA